MWMQLSDGVGAAHINFYVAKSFLPADIWWPFTETEFSQCCLDDFKCNKLYCQIQVQLIWGFKVDMEKICVDY